MNAGGDPSMSYKLSLTHITLLVSVRKWNFQPSRTLPHRTTTKHNSWSADYQKSIAHTGHTRISHDQPSHMKSSTTISPLSWVFHRGRTICPHKPLPPLPFLLICLSALLLEQFHTTPREYLPHAEIRADWCSIWLCVGWAADVLCPLSSVHSLPHHSPIPPRSIVHRGGFCWGNNINSEYAETNFWGFARYAFGLCVCV